MNDLKQAPNYSDPDAGMEGGYPPLPNPKKSSSSATETPMLPTIDLTDKLAPRCPTGTENHPMRATERQPGATRRTGTTHRTGPLFPFGSIRHRPRRHRTIPLLVVAVVSLSPGCSNLTPAIFTHPGDAPRNTPMTPNVQLAGIESEQVYHKVREAASTHSVVLEVVGENAPIRVLPLPPEGQSVFVSNLLQDTGILEKLGTVEATLYRNSKDSIGGIRMEVKMNSTHDSVRPESDYALQPGDRLRVRKVEHVMLTNLVNGLIGL